MGNREDEKKFGGSANIKRSHVGETSIVKGMERYKLQWRDHLLRMDNTRFLRIPYHYISKGMRDVGRPKWRWSDHF
jgi:hypothetical protein